MLHAGPPLLEDRVRLEYMMSRSSTGISSLVLLGEKSLHTPQIAMLLEDIEQCKRGDNAKYEIVIAMIRK
jgi:hypothetical protein